MYQTPSLLIIHLIRRSSNTGGCDSMGTLGNVPLASAHGRCTVAALSSIKWKAHHKFHVSLVNMWPINMYCTIIFYILHCSYLRMAWWHSHMITWLYLHLMYVRIWQCNLRMHQNRHHTSNSFQLILLVWILTEQYISGNLVISLQFCFVFIWTPC